MLCLLAAPKKGGAYFKVRGSCHMKVQILVITYEKILVCLFSVHNIEGLSGHKHMSLMRDASGC